MGKKKKPERKLGGPYLAAAVFCDQVLNETDKSVSAIRITDGVQVRLGADAPAEVPSEGHRVQIAHTILLIFRSGDAGGMHQLRLTLTDPSGKSGKLIEREVELSTPHNGGANMKFNMKLGVYLSGIYYIDVRLDGKFITRMPFQVDIARLPAESKEDATAVEPAVASSGKKGKR